MCVKITVIEASGRQARGLIRRQMKEVKHRRLLKRLIAEVRQLRKEVRHA